MWCGLVSRTMLLLGAVYYNIGKNKTDVHESNKGY